MLLLVVCKYLIVYHQFSSNIGILLDWNFLLSFKIKKYISLTQTSDSLSRSIAILEVFSGLISSSIVVSCFRFTYISVSRIYEETFIFAEMHILYYKICTINVITRITLFFLFPNEFCMQFSKLNYPKHNISRTLDNPQIPMVCTSWKEVSSCVWPLFSLQTTQIKQFKISNFFFYKINIQKKCCIQIKMRKT